MLVLDANILMRAVLGTHARMLWAKYAGRVEFVAPDPAFIEARARLPEVLERRGLVPEPFIEYLDSLAQIVRSVHRDSYGDFEFVARQRLARRDVELYLSESAESD
jgi:predicted nucleic acid-binding protein